MYVYFFFYFFQNYNTYISICVLFAFLRGGWVGGREGMGGKERPGGERPLFPGHNGRVSSSAIGLDAASHSLNQPTHNSFLLHNRSNFLCLSVCTSLSAFLWDWLTSCLLFVRTRSCFVLRISEPRYIILSSFIVIVSLIVYLRIHLLS